MGTWIGQLKRLQGPHTSQMNKSFWTCCSLFLRLQLCLILKLIAISFFPAKLHVSITLQKPRQCWQLHGLILHDSTESSLPKLPTLPNFCTLMQPQDSPLSICCPEGAWCSCWGSSCIHQSGFFSWSISRVQLWKTPHTFPVFQTFQWG